MQQIVQAKMMQNSMQRDGSNMEMGGRRSNSPGTMDNVPSPSKRARLDGGSGFNGQPMGPAGRGQPMSGPQMNTLNAAAGPNGGMMMQNGVADLQHQQQLAFAGQTPNIPQKQIEAMNANMQAGQLPGQAMDGIDFSGINGPRMGAAGTTQGGNHALQDYQMQLMLLEQQNKKRLLMARQEQDNMGTPHPGAGANPQFTMAASMSPSQSRAGGPSPNPNEMKRVASTPKLAQGGVPGSPMPDMQNRGSPAPGFDPSQMAQGMHPSIYNQMAANIGRAPSSHPGYPMSNLSQQQQLEVLRRSGGMIANGQPFPQGPQILQQNIQNPQQPPPQLGTPQQRHGTMAPPPAPAASQEQQRTQPSSPAQNQAPPNPSQNPKGAPKSKKEAKAAANKVCFECATFGPLIRSNSQRRKTPRRNKTQRRQLLPRKAQSRQHQPRPLLSLLVTQIPSTSSKTATTQPTPSSRPTPQRTRRSRAQRSNRPHLPHPPCRLRRRRLRPWTSTPGRTLGSPSATTWAHPASTSTSPPAWTRPTCSTTLISTAC